MHSTGCSADNWLQAFMLAICRVHSIQNITHARYTMVQPEGSMIESIDHQLDRRGEGTKCAQSRKQGKRRKVVSIVVSNCTHTHTHNSIDYTKTGLDLEKDRILGMARNGKDE